MIVYGKVTHGIFHSQDGSYHVFNIRLPGGRPLVATYVGIDPPQPRKTVEYEFRGDEVIHPKYGRQLAVTTYCRSNVKTEGLHLSRNLKNFEDEVNKHMRDL